jgi:hypothetical protein
LVRREEEEEKERGRIEEEAAATLEATKQLAREVGDVHRRSV